MGAALTDNLVQFTRYLRERGLGVVPATTGDLLQALHAVGVTSRDDARHAFRAVTVVRPEELAAFEQAFDAFFGPGFAPASANPTLDTLRRSSVVLPSVPPIGRGGDDGVGDPKDLTEQVGAGYAERLVHRDFAELSAEERDEVHQLMARMLWRPSQALSRRWVRARRGRRPDLRGTFRTMVGPQRDLLPLAMSAPRPRRRPLLVVADVSGSMERYSEMLLHFVHAARARLGRVEAFVFSTRLTRITRQLRHRDPEVALSQVADVVHDWSGGTRIGEALHDFNHTWSRRVTRGGPVAVVISDGWDRGDPEELRNEMARFARSVHRVVWLNPRAGKEGFSPDTRGMRAALPFVDHFIPAANLADLGEVVRLLESVPTRRREV